MSNRKGPLSSKLTCAAVTRRQFMKLAGVSVASAGAVSWPSPLLFAAQPARKRIIIHGERQVTSLGYHNRRETEHVSMVDAGLVTQNPVTLERVPVLAEELPSVKKGTWKIDTQKKTMITVYKLRPGLTWHDGKPYTSKDFEFGSQIAKHPEFPMPDRLVPDLISKIATPDDRTIVIHWNDLYNEAYAIQYSHVRAFPRHLLPEAFSAGDMKAFANLPYWNKNFVGAGPYRVVEWDAGTRMELEAFKDFTLGRPKIDRVTLQDRGGYQHQSGRSAGWRSDLCMRSTISFDGAMILREQWEKPGRGKIYISPASWSWLNLSRDNPWFSRSSLLEVLHLDYLTTASQGLSEEVVIGRHALKNALIPVVTIIAVTMPRVVGGSTMVETVFAYPGMGRLLYTSIMGNELVVAMTVVMIIAMTVIFFNLFADILYGWLDPRIRYQN